MLKKITSFILAISMVIGMVSKTFALENISGKIYKAPVILQETDKIRTAVSGNVTATFDKEKNTVYVNDGVNEYSFSTEAPENKLAYTAYSNHVIKEESVALHAYKYAKNSSGKYYYGIDIPSYSINPNNWCGWISVWDDESREGQYAAKFAKCIDDAQDAEHTIAIYGGATAVAVTTGLITKNPKWSADAFKAVCAAAGVLVSVGILNAAADYFNNLNNARENYFAIRNIVG